MESSVTVDKVVEPSRNCTVPVATAPLPVTLAVNVTDCPAAEGFTDDVSAVVLAALLTVCVRVADVLPSQFTPPLYVALKLWLPTARLLSVNLAVPELVGLDPSTTLPSRKVTVPVGTEFVAVTVAVRVTAWLKTDGFGEEVSAVLVVAWFTI